MKAEIHPDYKETTIQCTCGAIYPTRSTVNDLRVGICGACHPFFTGEQRFVDTAGRVEKFAKRYGGSQERRVEKPRRDVEPQKPRKPKEEKVEAEEAPVAETPAPEASPAPEAVVDAPAASSAPEAAVDAPEVAVDAPAAAAEAPEAKADESEA